MGFDTADNIINDAAIEIGLYSTPIADPYASTEPNVVQLRAYLKSLGRELVRDFAWSQLSKTHTFSTADAVENYVLPDDYARMVDQTQWNRTSTLPLAPTSAQTWQVLKATAAVGTVNRMFRIVANELILHPVPSATETLAYEYTSTYWVRPTGEVLPTLDAPASSTDCLWFDPLLLIRGLKLAYLENKGFDTTGAQRKFNEAWAALTGGESPAPVLSLGGSGDGLLDYRNIPDTGFGQ